MSQLRDFTADIWGLRIPQLIHPALLVSRQAQRWVCTGVQDGGPFGDPAQVHDVLPGPQGRLLMLPPREGAS